jgi:hypothetical protein
MREKLRFLGMDVHAETIAVAIAEDGEVRSLGTIANREESVRKFIRKLGPTEHLRACYEAGPTGFVLYWQFAQLGVDCAVIAPNLVPKKTGDRVKTDRRDALKLARSHRSGDLTAWPHTGKQPERRLSGLDRSKGDATASPFHLLVEAPIGRGTKALNPGGAGAKPLLPSAPHAGRPLIMRDLAMMHQLRKVSHAWI